MTNSPLYRAAGLLLGGSLIAAAIAVNPVSAHGAPAAPAIKVPAPDSCNSSKTCLTETNQGHGAAIKAVSNDPVIGNFGQAAFLSQANGLGGIYAFSRFFYGGEFESGGDQAYGLIAATDAASGIPFLAEGTTGAFEVDGLGNGFFSGGVSATFFYSPSMNPDGTAVTKFGTQSTRETLEDTGSGNLSNGIARVQFDRAFSRTIDARAGFQVFITPDGDSRGWLYVAQKSSNGFVVRESQNGRSSIAFDYRVVARPAGSNGARLPAFTMHKTPNVRHFAP